MFTPYTWTRGGCQEVAGTRTGYHHGDLGAALIDSRPAADPTRRSGGADGPGGDPARRGVPERRIPSFRRPRGTVAGGRDRHRRPDGRTHAPIGEPTRHRGEPGTQSAPVRRARLHRIRVGRAGLVHRGLLRLRGHLGGRRRAPAAVSRTGRCTRCDGGRRCAETESARRPRSGRAGRPCTDSPNWPCADRYAASRVPIWMHWRNERSTTSSPGWWVEPLGRLPNSVVRARREPATQPQRNQGTGDFKGPRSRFFAVVEAKR